MNFWPRYVGDIQRKTGHLSCAEMGVYDRLLDHMYATEEPLPGDVDAICRIARAMDKTERAAVASVLRQFFMLDDGAYTNPRVTQEIAKALPKLEAARANGKRGGRPKQTEQKPNGLPDGFPAGTHEEPTREAPQNQSIPSEYVSVGAKAPTSSAAPTRPRGGVSQFPPGFDRFWAAYPRHEAKAKAAQAFARIRPDESLLGVMLAAIQRQRETDQWRRDGGVFIPHPTTWLNGRRWEDESTSATTVEAWKRGVI